MDCPLNVAGSVLGFLLTYRYPPAQKPHRLHPTRHHAILGGLCRGVYALKQFSSERLKI
jgi:hypothetical protein